MNRTALKNAGIDFDDGMHRFCDNAEMYEKYLRKLTSLSLMDELETAFYSKNYPDAFKICHKLKAFVGNLSIPVLYESVCALTEALRNEGVDEAICAKLLSEVKTEFTRVTSVITEEMSNE